MNQQHAGDCINFYRGYRQLVNSKKSDVGKRRVRIIAPISVLAVALLGVAAVVFAEIREKTDALDGIQLQMEQRQTGYEQARALSDECAKLEERYNQLAAGRFLFTINPPLTRELFTQVRACAGDIFNISAYAYDETTRTLTVNASADSVNEVPKFVERLRDTELFESVQYTGYTSESEETYFCTVGCTLGMVNELDAAAEDSAADN